MRFLRRFFFKWNGRGVLETYPRYAWSGTGRRLPLFLLGEKDIIELHGTYLAEWTPVGVTRERFLLFFFFE
jgi:hypothetical protein